MLRRLEDTIKLLPCAEYPIRFNLRDSEAQQSNEVYSQFKKALRARPKDDKGVDTSRGSPFRSLTQAFHHASLPHLVELMSFIRFESFVYGLEEEDDALFDQDATPQWQH
jgi:hypothetical protein